MKIRGLTIIEVVVAIAALSVVLGVIGTLMAGSLRENRNLGSKGQANQLAVFIGRQLMDDSAVAPALNGTNTWTYGQLTTQFPGLTQENKFGDVNLYKATVVNRGVPSWGANMSIWQYRINVCWKAMKETSQDNGERCTQTDTIGPIPTPTNNPDQDVDMAN